MLQQTLPFKPKYKCVPFVFKSRHVLWFPDEPSWLHIIASAYLCFSLPCRVHAFVLNNIAAGPWRLKGWLHYVPQLIAGLWSAMVIFSEVLLVLINYGTFDVK